METATDNQQKALDYAKRHGPFRPREVRELGVHPQDIRRLCDKGLLNRVSRGLYELADAEPVEHQTLVEACKLVPHGVVCLLSALHFHSVGTQLPHKVWLAIPATANRPRVSNPPLELTYLTDAMYAEGIEVHKRSAGAIRVYSLAKTLVDCFRFRSKVGTDVAVEALSDAVRNRRQFGVTIGQLSELAERCRVGSVMRPYLEAMIT
jgi:predicted transcriptional regulator of viral defense system